MYFNYHISVCYESTHLGNEKLSPETKLNFCNWQKTQGCTFSVYIDLEALLVPEQKGIGRSIIVIESQLPASCGAVFVESRSNSVVKEFFKCREDSTNKPLCCLRRGLTFCDTVIWIKSWAQKNGNSFYGPVRGNVLYAKAELEVMRSSIIITRQARCMDSLTRNVI